MYNRPIGFDVARLPVDGVAPSAGATAPAWAGIEPAAGTAGPREESAEAGPSAASAGALFTVRSETYRLRRTDADWRQRLDEVLLPPEEAAGVLADAIVQHERNGDLAALLRTAASRLAGFEGHGVFVLLRVRRQPDSIRPPAQATAATPSALRPAVPFDLPPSLDEPILGDAQAAALRNAAAQGVPFCEECARKAAARRGMSPAA